MKVVKIILISISVLIVSSPAISGSLKIATWNIDHLRDSNNEGPNQRNQTDYDRLANYVKQLVADVIALQEVEGESLKKKLSDHCPISIILDPALIEIDPKTQKVLNKIDLIEKQLEELRQLIKEPE